MNKAMNTFNKKRTIYNLQGNIAAGKSHILSLLKTKNIQVMQEPIEDWKVLLNKKLDERGNDFNTHIQTRICNSLAKRETEVRDKMEEFSNIIIERDIGSAEYVFIPVAIENKLIDPESEKTLKMVSDNLKKLRILEDRLWETLNQCKISRESLLEYETEKF